jgi:epoxide hydrolase-like predicted phosphatase
VAIGGGAGKSMNAIEAVIFDIGNVLLPFNWDIAADRFCTRTGHTRRELDDFIVTTPFVHQLEIGQITGPQFFAILAREFVFTGSYEEFAWIWSDIFTPDEAMIALAAKLKGHRLRYILSNTNDIHMDFILKQFPFMHEFEGHILSYKVGLQKPDPAIYHLTLQKFGLVAEHCVYIDDLVANAEGARSVGMQAIHHRDAATTRRELTKLGVAPI